MSVVLQCISIDWFDDETVPALRRKSLTRIKLFRDFSSLQIELFLYISFNEVGTLPNETPWEIFSLKLLQT